jgi:hypothetical protein
VRFIDLSLEGGELEWTHKNAPRLLGLGLLSSLLFVVAFILLVKTPPGLLRTLAAIAMIISTASTLSLNYGATLQNHGQYNVAMLVTVWVVCLGIYVIYKLMRALGRKRMLILTLVMSVVLSLVLLRAASIANARWPTGLNGTKMQFEWPGCSVPSSFLNIMDFVPTGYTRPLFSPTCQPIEYDGIFDAHIDSNGYLHVNCSDPAGAIVDEAPNYLAEREKQGALAQNEVGYLYKRLPTQLTHQYKNPIKLSRDYLRIRCGDTERYLVNPLEEPNIIGRVKPPTAANASTQQLNLMVLLLDNIARAHFHRRMLKTVAVRANIPGLADGVQ